MTTYSPTGPTYIDLFAGSGGLSLGLEQAGFYPLYVNELNQDAMETYLINRDDKHPYMRERFHSFDAKSLIQDDARSLHLLAKDLRETFGVETSKGDLDLLVGGPPCQGYSGIGHRRSYAVDRQQLPSNHLYQDMAFIIHVLRPKIFLFENVKGLLSAKWTTNGRKGEIWQDVLHTFKSIDGYTINYFLVHAKEYGVPQNRPRVLLVGVRDDLGVREIEGRRAGGYLPEPEDKAPDLVDVLGDLIDDQYENGGCTTHYPKEPFSDIQRYFRQINGESGILGAGDPVTEHEYSRHAPHIVAKFDYMLSHGGRVAESMRTKKFAQRVLPARWGSDGPSITATSLPDDYVHFSQPRTLTVREWARLQMFPDWYKFAGKRTTGGIRRAGNPQIGLHDREVPKYTQIGNAVPVGLARAVGQHFAELLEEHL